MWISPARPYVGVVARALPSAADVMSPYSEWRRVAPRAWRTVQSLVIPREATIYIYFYVQYYFCVEGGEGEVSARGTGPSAGKARVHERRTPSPDV